MSKVPLKQEEEDTEVVVADKINLATCNEHHHKQRSMEITIAVDSKAPHKVKKVGEWGRTGTGVPPPMHSSA